MIDTEIAIEQSNKYSARLSEIKNYFADKTTDWLTTNHSDRVKELAKVQNIRDYIYDFILRILDVPHSNLNYKGPSGRLRIKEQVQTFNDRAKLVAVQKQDLPFCCGIQEWGNFLFNNIEDNNPILYNLIIDWMRLESNLLMDNDMGAYSIVNYFIDTLFMDILEKRDDLTFIKEFTNPKTKATLKTFIFDNKIV